MLNGSAGVIADLSHPVPHIRLDQSPTILIAHPAFIPASFTRCGKCTLRLVSSSMFHSQ